MIIPSSSCVFEQSYPIHDAADWMDIIICDDGWWSHPHYFCQRCGRSAKNKNQQEEKSDSQLMMKEEVIIKVSRRHHFYEDRCCCIIAIAPVDGTTMLPSAIILLCTHETGNVFVPEPTKRVTTELQIGPRSVSRGYPSRSHCIFPTYVRSSIFDSRSHFKSPSCFSFVLTSVGIAAATNNLR